MHIVTRIALMIGLVWLGILVHPCGSQADAVDREPARLLAHAREVMGVASGQPASTRVIHYRASAAREQNFQSDRTYPPFFAAMAEQEIWFDPNSGVMRTQGTTVFPGSGPSPSPTSIDDGVHAVVLVAKAGQSGQESRPIARSQATARNLNPQAVIVDWSAAKDVHVVGMDTYRDYPRIVLARGAGASEQRLFLDPKTGFPVKLEFIEPHYLWGQRHIEYLWSNWLVKSGIAMPGSSFRLADGAIEISQTMGELTLVAADAAPSLAAPAVPATEPSDLPLFLQPIAPKPVQVGQDTWLLTNPGYSEAVTRVGDAIYVCDATQSEQRARQDAEAIAKLFPGTDTRKSTITVIVTDLAWPHVAGVRYWVSQGATIIAPRAARAFLEQVVARTWTSAPDTLERQRSSGAHPTPMKFVAADEWRGDGVRLVPIDGIGSEVALMVYVAGDRFLWASDYIQTLDEPSLYATEVLHAAEHAGLEPQRTAAEHLPLSDWSKVRLAQAPTARVLP